MGHRVTMISFAVACDNTSSKFRSSFPAKPVRPAMLLMLFVVPRPSTSQRASPAHLASRI